MSLRTQHDLAELRRERAVLEAATTGCSSARLAAVLRSGLERLMLSPRPAPTAAGAPRGGRLTYGADREKWKDDRRFRLTASMLPYWLGLQGSSKGRVRSRSEIIHVLADHHGLYDKQPENEFAKEMMQYGRDHEPIAITDYMELTRNLVGLGSTRVRKQPDSGEHKHEWDPESHPGATWEWHDFVSATPDGFVMNALESGLGRGLGLKGLLEVKCPALRFTRMTAIDGVARRHHPDQRLRIEDDTYTLLQCFMQLVVCTEATFVDIVYFKRVNPEDVRAAENEGVAFLEGDYVWISRLYREDGAMGELKVLMKGSMGLFAKAMHAMRHDPRALISDEDTLDLITRDKIKAVLKEWTHRALRWRSGFEEGFPWRSMRDLEGSSEPQLPFGLVHRYHVDTGIAYNHNSIAAADGYRFVQTEAQVAADEGEGVSIGYKPVQKLGYRGPALTAADVYSVEPIGMHVR